jgi:16S rRNA (cytosine1402-N4)-methyltransferase
MSEAGQRHAPVLLDRCVDLLAPALQHEGALLVDATVGLGGHSQALLRRCPAARLVGIDRDAEALSLAASRLEPFGSRVHLVHAVFDELPAVLAALGENHADAVLLDLGVSSLQLDEPQRGFAYAVDAPLDMRMDASTGITAAQVLNTYSAAEIARVLREYGEERYARRIAETVVRERAREPFTTSARLVDLVRACVPAATRRTGGHPAKRTFQALRIEVNGELDGLARAVPAALDCLAVDGRIVVLSYHSLEDRIVKQALAAGTRSTTPPGLPVELPGHEPYLRLLTRGAERPTDVERVVNPRASSARLRAAVRTRRTPQARRTGAADSGGTQP